MFHRLRLQPPAIKHQLCFSTRIKKASRCGCFCSDEGLFNPVGVCVCVCTHSCRICTLQDWLVCSSSSTDESADQISGNQTGSSTALVFPPPPPSGGIFRFIFASSSLNAAVNGPEPQARARQSALPWVERRLLATVQFQTRPPLIETIRPSLAFRSPTVPRLYSPLRIRV